METVLTAPRSVHQTKRKAAALFGLLLYEDIDILGLITGEAIELIQGLLSDPDAESDAPVIGWPSSTALARIDSLIHILPDIKLLTAYSAAGVMTIVKKTPVPHGSLFRGDLLGIIILAVADLKEANSLILPGKHFTHNVAYIKINQCIKDLPPFSKSLAFIMPAKQRLPL